MYHGRRVCQKNIGISKTAVSSLPRNTCMEVEYLAKKRVYEVAKQLNISNKELIDKLKGQ